VGLDIPIAGYRRQVGVYEVSPALGAELPIVVVPPREAEAATPYFRHDGPGRMLAGVHSEECDADGAEDPDAYDRHADPTFTEDLAIKVQGRLEAGYELSAVGGWSGLYPLSPDGEPILGEAMALPGFYNAVGLGGNGIQLSAAVGRIIADLVVDGSSDLAPGLDRYRLERLGRLRDASRKQ
jgi:sarcosine oxidase, subunit beta